MPAYLQVLFKTVNFNIGSLYFSPPYWQAGAFIFLIFLLIVMLAQFRRHYLNWSFKGALFGLFWGFILALALEAFLSINGKTVLTQILGWKNPPKPIMNVLDSGREKLVNVLGAQVQLSGTTTSLINSFQSLSPIDAAHARAIICKP